MKVPAKAVNILLNEPQTIVVALPDLYPKNKGFAHETADELIKHDTKHIQRKACALRGIPMIYL
ncbi:MAG: hypothetical protein GXY40_08165 [Syntrophomonadaceae bacterium]|nr:hypothetical protein [Syntrophomonadaceae bacterium]